MKIYVAGGRPLEPDSLYSLLDQFQREPPGCAGSPRRYRLARRRLSRAGRKWLARMLAESPALTLNEAMVALGCLRGLREGYEPSREVLRALMKRRHETRER